LKLAASQTRQMFKDSEVIYHCIKVESGIIYRVLHPCHETYHSQSADCPSAPAIERFFRCMQEAPALYVAGIILCEERLLPVASPRHWILDKWRRGSPCLLSSDPSWPLHEVAALKGGRRNEEEEGSNGARFRVSKFFLVKMVYFKVNGS
jgi:hypothetical protein